MKTVAEFAVELSIPAQLLLEHLQRIGITKKDSAQRLSDADISKLLKLLVRQTKPSKTSHKQALIKRAADENESTLSARRIANAFGVQPRPMRVSEGAESRAPSIQAPYTLPLEVQAPTAATQKLRAKAVAQAQSAKEKPSVATLTENKYISCSCNGDNEHCYKCDGKGWLNPSDLSAAPVNFPPVLKHYSEAKQAAFVGCLAETFKKSGKPKAVKADHAPKQKSTREAKAQVERPAATSKPKPPRNDLLPDLVRNAFRVCG